MVKEGLSAVSNTTSVILKPRSWFCLTTILLHGLGEFLPHIIILQGGSWVNALVGEELNSLVV